MNHSREKEVSELSLIERLRESIRLAGGAISFRDWMEAALYDGREGYYCRPVERRWGRKGDYRTSPEWSPLFAATFARYFAHLYETLGSPPRWTIAEAGAGRGFFIAGALKTLERDYPRIFSATTCVIDEASATERARLQKLLAPFGERVAYRRLSDASEPVDACVIFSNELLDAFPVNRVTLNAGHLVELGVGLNSSGDFIWTAREPASQRLAEYIRRAGVQLEEGQIVEVNLQVENWMQMAARVMRRGYVITVDYGAERDDLFNAPHRRKGTLRAFRRHQLSDDPLSCPGEQDLTTTIDWGHAREAGEAAGLTTVRFERQDKFLLEAGLLDMLELMLARSSDEAERASLLLGAREMIMPGGMSQSFHVLVQKKETDS